ncbi:unnamed protein product [Trifolium pratense]|uniref:Uncharacterized protein n=1 Tax=Trifolium pratense TaxID=57577 RepID=A0ACB0K9L1_TRIPR|nr:unnamed protein product [Trifolium pratense]
MWTDDHNMFEKMYELIRCSLNPLRNAGDNKRSPPAPRFHSIVAEHKLRHFNSLILVFCLTTFSFSLASSVFMRSPPLTHLILLTLVPLRLIVAANAIVAVYFLFEMCTSVWEISRGATLFPEVLQVWFDFGITSIRTRTKHLLKSYYKN